MATGKAISAPTAFGERSERSARMSRTSDVVASPNIAGVTQSNAIWISLFGGNNVPSHTALRCGPANETAPTQPIHHAPIHSSAGTMPAQYHQADRRFAFCICHQSGLGLM
ncbi:hypothetical protein [Actinokineospora sp.]|uniref:hypothetical protein n=1 Tax=Actinokineospora sp. TaxID=1872133 RepID=UPI003D6A764C